MEAGLESLGADGATSVMHALSQPASNYGNSADVEALWCLAAVKFSELHFDIIASVDAKLLRLTPYDDIIAEHFRSWFPKLNVVKLRVQELHDMEEKRKWNRFCEAYKFYADFNFCTLLRVDATQGYTEENTVLVPRIQFYAIEIERNRTGANDVVRHREGMCISCSSLQETEASEKGDG
ncbi:unnamed protein product [Notodromas monacha]|uniref:Polysaccharide biosynthesis domain-containing protein n=1 Tax=Notodromas monacha TaxID=399045 RepID=A0A7R9BHI5_9CRUS|nr:unnamed protein product [Notodromas monacha]CAG0915568.1 unnamed protein product [Notodromas monacha]